jgi:hypothetical protein
MRVRAIVLAATAMAGGILAGAPALAACAVGDFTPKPAAQLSQVQQLAYFRSVGPREHQRLLASGVRTGWYALLDGAPDYEAFRDTVVRLTEHLQIDGFRTYRTSWAQSALSDPGRAGYRACLRAEGGLQISVADLGATEGRMAVDWTPGADGALRHPPQIKSSRNVANLAELQQRFDAGPWGVEPQAFDVVVKRIDPSAAAELTIRSARGAFLVYLPPADVAVSRPSVQPQGVWSDVAVIDRKAPAGALGGTITVEVNANAFGGRDAAMWIDVAMETASQPLRRRCATGRQDRAGNMSLRLDPQSCTFAVPLDARRIRIETGADQAEARSVAARLSY